MPRADHAARRWTRRSETFMDSRTMRRSFFAHLFTALGVVWPILSGLLVLMTTFGLIVGAIEEWSVGESLYFAFVSGLTIGYGDLAPEAPLSRVFAILIGLCGILLTALVAAVAVKALPAPSDSGKNTAEGTSNRPTI
jgi:hypothetical protein